MVILKFISEINPIPATTKLIPYRPNLKTGPLSKKFATKRFAFFFQQQILPFFFQGYDAKNLIVFGNSHAYKAFIGIVQIFKPIARHITLISMSACVPGSKNFQHHALYRVNYAKILKFFSGLEPKGEV